MMWEDVRETGVDGEKPAEYEKVSRCLHGWKEL